MTGAEKPALAHEPAAAARRALGYLPCQQTEHELFESPACRVRSCAELRRAWSERECALCSIQAVRAALLAVVTLLPERVDGHASELARYASFHP